MVDDMSEQTYRVYMNPIPGSTVWLPNHRPEHCQGTHCTMHDPSEHHMKDWELLWRSDSALFERLCPEHGVGHPDPDCLNYLIRTLGSDGVAKAMHGCCGCCDIVNGPYAPATRAAATRLINRHPREGKKRKGGK